MQKEAVGKRIIELCEKEKITINGLAVKADIPPSTLKNIIYGQVSNTGIETLSKICDGLNISISDFFQGEDFREGCHREEIDKNI